MKTIILPIATVALLFTNPTVATAAKAPAPKQCTQITKQYPLNHCRKRDAACLEQNAKNRQARIDAGCKATKNYDY